ncbi:aminoglycoside phosphotransferase family protein [Mesorhizobium sp. LHD-90]|uniref:phosphotransferase family protein n=1 Tax=Mesorhizobium sp. LHD-90 TaxID=3071414 RepID=UPI0027E02A97|nr:aminoglycoside phosphotransferase family protein [Mesorhizobium sp. LHD-90]MDQ6434839.1 aminoglycoside phosphotransferase family protein [Mesorhizobium sp. LHD-90]
MVGVEDDVLTGLAGLGLLGRDERPELEPLGGGVSSEIWKVSTANGDLCVKRALARLKVAAVWEAPLERSHYEAEWMRVASAICPENVPELIAEDVDRHLVVMRFLPPSQYGLWKTMLRDGHTDPIFAAEVGRVLAAIHAATADDPGIAERFATDAAFHAIRLEPYLEATANKHADVADRLFALSATTAATRRCLVHGDVSPKNMLAGPKGPVILDAECAWFGDPAFDLGFVLNHLLLKCVWTPAAGQKFLACFAALSEAYLAGVAWEPAAALEARVAALLPGLMLARIDGKSPVEYITAETDRNRVRRFAIPLLKQPVERVADIAARWHKEIA